MEVVLSAKFAVVGKVSIERDCLHITAVRHSLSGSALVKAILGETGNHVKSESVVPGSLVGGIIVDNRGVI